MVNIILAAPSDPDSKDCGTCQGFFQAVCGAPAGTPGETEAITFHNDCRRRLHNCQTGQSECHADYKIKLLFVNPLSRFAR